MAWTAPRTWVPGELVTAALLNVHLRNNLLATLAAIVTTAGDIGYATAANTLSRLAIGTARQQLATNAGATAPEWVASLQSLMTAQGDIVYASAANTPAGLAKGTAGQVLTMGAAVPAWATAAAGSTIVTGSYTGNGATSMAVTGLGITPKYVEVWMREVTSGTVIPDYSWCFTTAEIMDDSANKMAIEGKPQYYREGKIIAFASGSFTVSDQDVDAHPNKNGVVYNYMVIG